MRAVFALIAAAGCGRFAFDPMDQAAIDDAGSGVVADDGGGSGVDAPPSTGPQGPRWIKRFGNAGTKTGVGGGNGEVVVVQNFSTSLSGDDVSFTGNGFSSTALARYDALGNVKFSVTLDATGFCDMRDAMIDGDDVIVAGLTIGTQTIPAYGACSIASNRQDPIALRVGSPTDQEVLAHWRATTSNAQAWSVAQLADKSLVVAGIYGAALMLDAPLPTAQADPSAWIARSLPGTPTSATWSAGMTTTVEIHGGPVDADGMEVCAMGSFRGPATVLGTALPHVAGFDTWVARLRADGTPTFVRAIGSTANESSNGNSSITATPDGGCAIAIVSNGDITVDSLTFPASAGSGLILRFDAAGTVVAGTRVPTPPSVEVTGGRLYAAFYVAAPYTAGSDVHTPQGEDGIVIELDASGPSRLVGVVGGAGNQRAIDLNAAADDALIITVTSTGALSFGSSSFDTGASQVRAHAVLGL